MNDSKAFDLKELERALVAKGLVQAEGAAQILVETIFDWAKDGIAKSETKLDDLALGVVTELEDFLLQKIANISDE